MTVTGSRDALRWIALVGVAALLASLLPAGATARAHDAGECAQATFADRDDIAAVHVGNVDCVAERGIVAGFEDGTFRPAAGVRRDQLATFLFRTLVLGGVDLPAPDTARFADVAQGSAHDEAIHRLKAAGIAQGAGGGEGFGPATLIRRDQLVSFLARGIEFAVPGTIHLDERRPTRFGDVPAGNVHSGNIEQIADLGIVQGVAEQAFGPSAGSRRDQLATFMVRLFDRLAGDAPAPAEATLALTLSRSFAGPDEEVVATATVEEDGAPVAGVAVGFTATGAAPAPASGTETTGAGGEAAWTFTSAETGLVTVTATATHAGATLSRQAQVVFSTGPSEDQFAVTVEPATVEVGDTVTATATLTTASGAPVSGRPVDFTTSGASADPSSGSVALAAGEASFTFTATSAGTITVTARALLNPHHEIVARTATVTVN